jgi:hypothetical protein
VFQFFNVFSRVKAAQPVCGTARKQNRKRKTQRHTGTAPLLSQMPSYTMQKFEMQDIETDNAVILAEHKLAASFCGGCCDMKRGVIIANAVYAFISLISILRKHEMVQEGREAIVLFDQVNDDVLKEVTDNTTEMLTTLDNALILITWILVFGMFFSALSIYGAVQYKFWPVVVGAAYNVVAFLACAAINGSTGTKVPVFDADPIRIYVFPLLATLFHCYPNAYFAYQLKTGVMSQERYQYEKSCCCDNRGPSEH